MTDETPKRPKSTSWSVDPKEIAGQVTFLMFPPLGYRITNYISRATYFRRLRGGIRALWFREWALWTNIV